MALNLDQMRSRLRKALGVDEVDMSNSDATLLLNRAYWDILDIIKFREKERTVSFNTVLGVRKYIMPDPFEAIQVLSVRDLYDNSHTPLGYMERTEYESVYDSDIEAYGKPTRYVREDKTAIIYPTPDDVYLVTVRYLTTLDDLSDTNLTPPIPQAWHEIIEMGGIYRAFIDIGDWNRARAAKQEMMELISTKQPTQAKERGYDQMAGLQVLRRRY